MHHKSPHSIPKISWKDRLAAQHAKAIAVVAIGLLALSMFLSGCGGGGGATENVWTPEKQASIDQGRATVQSAIAGESSFDTTEGRQRVANAVKNTPNIEYAAVTSDGSLSVKYKQGGVEVYLHDTPSVPPPDRSRNSSVGNFQSLLKNRTQLQSNKVVVVNSISDDPQFERQTERMHDIVAGLQNANQNVTLLEGAGVNPQSLAGLSNNSLLIFFGHGGFFKASGNLEEYNFQTGVLWDDRNQYSDWIAEGLIPVQVDWGTGFGRSSNHKVFVGITAKYWTKAYASSHFNHALMINGSCHGSQDSNFISALSGLGISSYVGWNQTTSLGADTDAMLTGYLINGGNIQSAFDSIPFYYRQEIVFEGILPHLASLTLSGDHSVKLKFPLDSPTFLHIDSPTNGQSTTNPVVSVSGHVDSWDPNWNLALDLNNSLSKIPVASDGTFNMSVALASGDNTIQIRLETPFGVEHHVLHVTANIPAQAFWSEMRWNTNSNDIDLHLMPVGATPWSTSDCYYGHKNADWGGSLDVDITTGYGPEHITAPTSIAPGKYLLFVHYFATHGVTGPVAPSVSFVVNGVTKFYNCPQPMTAAENVWNVAYITYPSGEITPINEFVQVGRGRGEHPPKK